MRTPEEIRAKLEVLRDFSKDLEFESNYILNKITKGLGVLSTEELSQMQSQLISIRNQAFEVLSNTRALKWALGEISDVEFATEGAANLLDRLNFEDNSE